MPEPDGTVFRVLRIYCRTAALLVAFLGFSVLCGWAFHVPVLTSIVPGFVTMKPNTALCLLLCGTSLWLILPEPRNGRRRLASRTLTSLAMVVAAITALEYLLKKDLGIDHVLFREPVGAVATLFPGRMSQATCTGFLMVGLSLLLLDRKIRHANAWAQVLSVMPVLMAVVTATGYAYHATVLSRIFLHTQVALHTAIGLLLLGTAIFFARPGDGIASDLTSEGSGSVMARLLLPTVFFVPILLGWVSLHGDFDGAYGKEFHFALFASSTVIVFGLLVWVSARKMNGEYDRRGRAEAGIRELNADLEVRVAERTKSLGQQTAVLSEQAALLDLAHDAIIVRDMQSHIMFWSRGAEAMYGWSANLAIGKVGSELLKAELPRPLEEIESQVMREGHWEGEVVHHTRNGTRLNVGARWALQRGADGTPVGMLIINSDISERKKSEDALFAEKERAQVTLNSIGDAVICTDISGNITFVNLVAEKMTGWSQKDAMGRPMEEVAPILDASSGEAIPNPMELAILEDRTMSLPGNCHLIQRDGAKIPIEDSVSPIHDRQGKATGAVIVFRDVSAARTMALQMAHSAQHDFLTGLPNRMLLNDRVKQAITSAPRHLKKVAILFLDLDGFKHINDSLGHPTGDKLLQSIAKRLGDCVRSSDTVSRQGGDEFVVLLSEVERAEDAALTARRILQAVAEPHSIDQHDLHVTTSIGLSVYPDDGIDSETLIKNADTAMYQAKENGRQSFQFFKPAMNARAVERQSIEEGLRRALEKQEFMLHYQPKLNLKTGEITGAEALIRWRHPLRGLVSPATFIPIAEDCGLILPIGHWALHEACKQARVWVEAGLPLGTMAVNISAMEFRDENFLERVFAILDNTGLDPRGLELELTEGVLMKHAESTESVLKKLRARGVRVAVDDFGTGYSSLSYLRNFSIDALKIDQSFVRQITTAPDQTTIVTAIISMGRNLNLRVVAEGVETHEEMAFLQAHQCDEAQGYYFSRPVPPEQFAKLLKSGVLEIVLHCVGPA